VENETNTKPRPLAAADDATTGCGSAASWILKGVWDQASRGMAMMPCSARRSCQLHRQLAERAARSGRRLLRRAVRRGREFNLSVLAGPDGPEVLPPAEIDFSPSARQTPHRGHRAKWQADSFEYHTRPAASISTGSTAAVGATAGAGRRVLDAVWAARLGTGRFPGRRRRAAVDPGGQRQPCLSHDAGFVAALQQAAILSRTRSDAYWRMHRDRPILAFATMFVPTTGKPFAGCGIYRGVLAVELDVAVELVDDRLKRGRHSDYHFVFAEDRGRTVATRAMAS